MRNRWGLCLLLGLSAMLMLALPAAAGAAAWSPEFSVSGPQDRSGAHDPAAVIDAEGNATYVWAQEIPDVIENKMVLRSRVYHADGSIGPIESITTTATAGGSYEPKVGIDGSGQVRVAWKQQRESCPSSCTHAYKVMTVHLDGNGAPIGAPLTVQEYGFSGNTVSGLSYAVNSAGTAVVGFEHITGPEAGSVMAFSVSSSGSITDISPAGETEVLNGELGIAINSSGAVFATWTASTISGTIVEGALLGGASPGTARNLAPSQNFGSEEPGLQALIDGDGNGTAVFALYDIGSVHRVFASRLNADGIIAGPVTISGISNEYGEFLAGGAAVEPDGSILVAWSREFESWITKLSPTGTVGQAEELTPGAVRGWSPHLGLDPAGDGVVMLESANEAKTVYWLNEVPIAASGVPNGPLARLAEAGHSFENESGRVAVSESGNAAVAWTSVEEELQATEVRGSLRDGIAPALSLSVPPKAQAGQATVMAASGVDASPIAYAWGFGDGSSGSEAIVSHAYGAPGTYTVTVTATDSAGNETSKQATVEVVAPSSSGSGSGAPSGGGGSQGPAPLARPQTMVLKAPPKQTRAKTVEVKFVASQAGSSFECALDAGGWKPCHSPLMLKNLKPGAATLKLRATSPSGMVEAGGPVLKFRVLKPAG
jgi:hypothetical protein